MVDAHSLQRVLTSAVAVGVVPGVVALAADDTGVCFAGAAGSRVVDGDADMRVDTIVKLASMTKAVTSVAALQLVEQGRIKLDDPLDDILPEIGTVQVLEGFAADGTSRLRPPRRAVTLRHLLTHTAGYAYHIWNADILRFHQQEGVPTIETARKACLGIPLIFDPGDQWEYGISTDWVGQMVERVSGQRLDAYLVEHILTPLEMNDTRYALQPDQRGRLAATHARLPDGSLEALPPGEQAEAEFLEGGGGLYSTGPDYLRFLRMLLGGGELDGVRILQPRTVAEMSTNHIGSLTAGMLNTVVPDVSNTIEFFPGTNPKWGLATLLTTQGTETGMAAGSLTWGGIRNTYFWVDPTRRVTGVLLTQILPFADHAVLDLFACFQHAVYADLAVTA